MDKKAMHKLSYGLYVVTTRDAEKANGCIVNTVIQAASGPNQICVCVNKANYTHDMLLKTGVFNVSVLSKTAQFPLYQRFGLFLFLVSLSCYVLFVLYFFFFISMV